jgi:hypothetical protein
MKQRRANALAGSNSGRGSARHVKERNNEMAEEGARASQAPNRVASRAVAVAAAVAFLVYFVVRSSVVVAGNAQWDFQTYYAAAKVFAQGGNPYDLAALSRAVGKTITLPYLYPIVVLYLFRPFCLLEYHTAYLAFFALKIAALAVLMLLWRKLFIREERHLPLFLILCAFAYNGPIFCDVVAGNVSTFEQLLIWSAVGFYLNRQIGLFCLLVSLSALFKGVSLVLLLLPLLGQERKSALRPVIMATAGFLALQSLSFVGQPVLYGQFLSRVASLDERGIINPSSMALARDCVDILFRRTGWSIHGLSAILYGVWVSVLAIATRLIVKTSGWCLDRKEMLFLFLFLYALILPRFKDYSYMLVIIPTWYAVQVVFHSQWARLAAVTALCIKSEVIAEAVKAVLPMGALHGGALSHRLLLAAVEFVVAYNSLLALGVLFALCLRRWRTAATRRFDHASRWLAAGSFEPVVRS